MSEATPVNEVIPEEKNSPGEINLLERLFWGLMGLSAIH
jgi:hypothetical protein